MSTSIESVIRRAAQWPGIYSFMRRLSPGPIILFYHGVEEQIIDSRVQTLHLPLKYFEEQITYLRKHFDIISLDQLYECISSGRRADPRQVIITFDDGYKNNASIVAPYLNSLGVPFAVFVSTRHIAEGIRFPTYYLRASILYSQKQHARILNDVYNIATLDRKQSAIRAISEKLKNAPLAIATQIVEELTDLVPQSEWAELNDRFFSDEPMNWGEVKQLHDQGVTIGSHCHDHFILHDKQSSDEILEQLHTSKSLIQEHVAECKYFAYPNGGMRDIFPGAVTSVEANDYLVGLTTIAGTVGRDTNPYVLPRVGADVPDMSHFMFIVNTSFRHDRSYREWSKFESP